MMPSTVLRHSNCCAYPGSFFGRSALCKRASFFKRANFFNSDKSFLIKDRGASKEKNRFNQEKGFTLIEVMVALAIFALIGVSIMQVTSTQLANTFYLEQRLTSQWLSENLINQMKVEPKQWGITRCGGSRSGEVEYLGRRWEYKLDIKANPFNIRANKLTGDYGKKLCQLDLELYLPDSTDGLVGQFRGFYGVTP